MNKQNNRKGCKSWPCILLLKTKEWFINLSVVIYQIFFWHMMITQALNGFVFPCWLSAVSPCCPDQILIDHGMENQTCLFSWNERYWNVFPSCIPVFFKWLMYQLTSKGVQENWILSWIFYLCKTLNWP